MKEKSALSAVLESKCPRCREGKMFTHGPYAISKLTSMHENCPVCGLRFESEPGFFYGAMYISYAFSVGIMLVCTFLVYNVVEDPEIWMYVVTVCVVSLLVYPLLFRYGRVVYMYIFGGVKYDPAAARTKSAGSGVADS